MTNDTSDQARIEAIIRDARCNSYSDVNFVKHIDGLLKPTHDAVFHYEDMLRFLAQQDSNSANICMNGIDDCIIQSEEYEKELVQQIARVVPVGGIAFGIGSPVLEGLKDHGLQRKTEILRQRIFGELFSGELFSYELVFEK